MASPIEIKAETATLPVEKLFDNSECCEDCPDINPNPPSESDCPDFKRTLDGKVVCERPTAFDRFMGGGGGAGTGVSDFTLQQLINKER